MRIIMIRHLPTPGNQRKCYIGRTDESLAMTEEVTNAILAKRSFLEWMEHPEAIVVSPMKRCTQTAEQLFGKREMIRCEKLKECDFGQFEGKNYEELSSDPFYQKWLDSNGTLPFPGGEDHEAFKMRCTEGFEEMVELLLEQHCELAAMVVHGGMIMSILEQFAEEKENFYHWQVENGGGYLVSLDEKTWREGEKVLRGIVRI